MASYWSAREYKSQIFDRYLDAIEWQFSWHGEIIKPAKCKFTWTQWLGFFSTKRKYGFMWNIYSPSLWETACNLRCTQLRIVHYATMYQSQSVCISRSGFRETGCFYETCCLCAPTSCDGVAPWASDFRPPHTMDTVERVHWLERANPQCNSTTLYLESKPTSHGSHERESIVVFDKVLAQLVEQIPNFTQIQFNTLPLWEFFSELTSALDM